MITEGTPCYIVSCSNHPEFVGRVVVTGRLRRFPEGMEWEVFAHWMPAHAPCWYAHPRCLRPLYGPMAQLQNALETAKPV